MPNELELFDKTYIQFETIYQEISLLSKKSPDGKINEFKLKSINSLLSRANNWLKGKYKPLDEFNLFESESLPSNSDVVFILSQYITCLKQYGSENTERFSGYDYLVFEGKRTDVITKEPWYRG